MIIMMRMVKGTAGRPGELILTLTAVSDTMYSQPLTVVPTPVGWGLLEWEYSGSADISGYQKNTKYDYGHNISTMIPATKNLVIVYRYQVAHGSTLGSHVVIHAVNGQVFLTPLSIVEDEFASRREDEDAWAILAGLVGKGEGVGWLIDFANDNKNCPSGSPLGDLMVAIKLLFAEYASRHTT